MARLKLSECLIKLLALARLADGREIKLRLRLLDCGSHAGQEGTVSATLLIAPPLLKLMEGASIEAVLDRVPVLVRDKGALDKAKHVNGRAARVSALDLRIPSVKARQQIEAGSRGVNQWVEGNAGAVECDDRRAARGPVWRQCQRELEGAATVDA